ncbi:glycosyltransferase family 4 protein [candidate division KSB1 bacterium]|nr:glycosyltransferase family 4 protein [candidate division KSB1 bacterium]NIR69144.1 glycosyltransferase family 4 protein [candidate division KSB1 bacterium]NIS25655.1 glycosyltransferase family 4 protein [candidate division KSB1 bacterium]NIT72523.1 glycosyltransferase family 4 protein [candidate division KSB1 bacterium]NIU26332.1 glycosyltransferase family 4 protein [candidate division KSB1 bacterium]
MKIAYIAAGAGGMYCGSCIHDNTLAAALARKGYDVALIPTYTPLRTDETSVSLDRIFFGGLNVYLQEKFALFRNTPAFIDKLLNNPVLLNWIARFGSTTDARVLGALTISMLKAEEGNQRKELHKLIEWLKKEYKPDIVQLTNSMFAGLAREVKKHLDVPVLCAVQGEDLFLDQLIEPYRAQALELLRERAQDIDGIIATSRYYAEFMADFLAFDKQKIHVVNLGISLQGHGNGELKIKKSSFVIGYLARICPEKGLHILVEAFRKLQSRVATDKLQLKVAGYLDKKDQAYFQKITKQASEWGLNGRFEYIGEVDRLSKIVFLNSLDVLSVPTVYKESKGLFVLEALANGVPVVQPRHGLFPEIIETTGGGLLVDPESSDALADGIHKLIKDKNLRTQLGQKGKSIVHQMFNDDAMAEATLNVYKKYVR